MKGKRLRGISAFLCIVFTCLCLTPAARAIEPLELHMEGVLAADGCIRIHCNSNAETIPQKSDFTATLGNMTLPVKDVTAFGDTDTGASYIFLVDVSGSIKQSQFQAIKDTLTLICAELTDKDNLSIFAIGNETYTQPFVSDPEDIRAQIEAIERSNEDTNLYDSVFKSLAILNTHEDCRDKKVLVVFSDGEEDSFAGITIDEAAIKINDSRIPIYTIAMLGSNPASRYVETAKVLGSFARLSAGGRHYIHTLDTAASETIAGEITDSIRNGLIVTAELDGFRSDGNEMDLALSLTIAGQGAASDGYAISTAGLSSQAEEQTPASPAPESPEPPEKTQSFLQEHLLWVIIGGSAVVLLAGLAVFLIRRQKKPEEPQPQAPEPVNTPTVAIQQAPPVLPNISQPPHGKPRIALRLTKIGLIEEQVFRAEFAGEIVLGRDSAKASLPFKNDELLSGRHCSVSYEPDGIVLRDLGSMNGTFVNGVPIGERRILENDDVLLIGSMELRVNWEEIPKL